MPTPNPNTPYLRRHIARNNLADAVRALTTEQLQELGTPMLVRVETVHNAGVSLTGMVDVLPLVTLQDGLGCPYPRETVYHAPYLRIQGGSSAIIMDPKPGDIGFIVISGRDHSHAIRTRAPSPPASNRLFAMQDCVYVGGFLNDAPNQYIHFTDEGIRIVTPGKVEIDAASVTANCDITTTGDVKAGGVSLKSHTHTGVQPGAGNSGKPQ